MTYTLQHEKPPTVGDTRVDQLIGEVLLTLWVVYSFGGFATGPFLSAPMFLGLAVVAMAGILLTAPRGTLPRIRVSVPTLLYMTVVLMSAAWSWDFWVWFSGARWEIGLILVAMLCAGHLDIWRMARSLVNAVYVAIPWTLFMVAANGEVGAAWRGGFPHKNTLGAFFAIAVVILLTLEKRPMWRLGGVTACAGILVLSQSTTALFMAMASVVALHALRRYAASPPREGSAYLLSRSLFIVALLVFLASQATAILDRLGKDTTYSGRTKIWPAVIEKVIERPLLGWGADPFLNVFEDPARFINRAADARVAHAHNMVLELLMRYGIVGTTFWMLLYFSVIVTSWRLLRTHTAWATMSLVFVLILTIRGFAEPTLEGYTAMLTFLHVLALRLNPPTLKRRTRGYQVDLPDGIELPPDPSDARPLRH